MENREFADSGIFGGAHGELSDFRTRPVGTDEYASSNNRTIVESSNDTFTSLVESNVNEAFAILDFRSAAIHQKVHFKSLYLNFNPIC
jgi:hypothetical protein